jgi:fumarylacetoacetase
VKVFPANHLPYGSFSTAADGSDQRLGVGFGSDIIDLRVLSESGLIADPFRTLRAKTLNAFMAEGPKRWLEVRAALLALASASIDPSFLIPQSQARLHLAWDVADYVDFFSSLDHAENCGRIFRPDADPLLPNWRHLPVGYHGRSGTVLVSGTPITRPKGQRQSPTGPVFGESVRLDVEAEVGFIIGVPTNQGTSVSTASFADHIFGVVLVNDWSARDIQAWEAQPLGPFLGKSFATSAAAWVTPLAALAGARCAPPIQEPAVMPYLVDDDPWSLDLRLSVAWNGEVVSEPPFASMYWTPGQQLAHMTVNGASLRTGDLFASGTVSGPLPSQRGSFLELSWGGTQSVTFADGSARTFLLDGDSVTVTATALGTDGTVFSLGEVSGTIRPAVS